MIELISTINITEGRLVYFKGGDQVEVCHFYIEKLRESSEELGRKMQKKHSCDVKGCSGTILSAFGDRMFCKYIRHKEAQLGNYKKPKTDESFRKEWCKDCGVMSVYTC